MTMARVLPTESAARRAGAAVLVAVAVASAGACRAAEGSVIPGASVERGRQSLAGFGCGSCHEIRGVTGARGKVGPPLDGVASRSIIAGELPNTPENMVRWIRDPVAIEPNTAMPNLEVSEETARDMVAYLYTLR
jgi:cytochrome c2